MVKAVGSIPIWTTKKIMRILDPCSYERKFRDPVGYKGKAIVHRPYVTPRPNNLYSCNEISFWALKMYGMTYEQQVHLNGIPYFDLPFIDDLCRRLGWKVEDCLKTYIEEPSEGKHNPNILPDYWSTKHYSRSKAQLKPEEAAYFGHMKPFNSWS